MTEVPATVAFLTVAAAAPFIAAFVGLILSNRASSAAHVSASVVGIGFAASVLVAVGSALGLAVTPKSFMLSGDPMSLVLITLVLGLSALIQVFSLRYLRGDPRHAWFVVTANLLTGFTVAMASASTLLWFGAAWTLAGASLVALLAMYNRNRQARHGIRRVASAFLIGDAALWSALGFILIQRGDIPLSQLSAVGRGLEQWQVITIGLLLATAALARSSQIPFQHWLPATLAAPTPVSALLHAGVVNAGAILIIRFSPIMLPAGPTMSLLALAGGATLVFGAAVGMTRPDVKGALVYSTIAQMGFMIMACGVGAFAAALVHLVAHSLYKSALFLGAGSLAADRAAQRSRPRADPLPRTKRVGAIVTASVVPATAIVVARLTVYPSASAASTALLVFVAATGTTVLAAFLLHRFTAVTVVVSVLGTAGASFLYVWLVDATTTILGPTLVASEPAASPWWLLPPTVALVLVLLLRRNGAWTAFVSDRVYVRALGTGTIARSNGPWLKLRPVRAARRVAEEILA